MTIDRRALDDALDAAARAVAGLQRVEHQLREMGVHVGINGRCVCGRPWPCPPLAGHESITCPRCGLTTYDPLEVIVGYCRHCDDTTSVTGVR